MKDSVKEMVKNAYAPGSMKAIKSALGAWADFEADYPERIMLWEPNFSGDMEASLHNELSLCMFAVWMMMQGLATSTCGTYLSLTRTSLGVSFGWALTCKELEMRLPRLLKGIRRTQKRIRKKRLGWRAAYERRLRAQRGEPRGREAWSETGLRCALRQGLLRGADIIPESASAFDETRHSLMRDIEHFDEPSPHFRLTVLPAKKGEQQGKTEFVYFPQGDGITDAYSAIRAMLAGKTEGERQPGEPLWTHADGAPWTIPQARGLFKASGKLLGIKEKFLGAQSGRVGGATDYFAEGSDPVSLQMMGRWDSVSPNRTRTPAPHDREHAPRARARAQPRTPHRAPRPAPRPKLKPHANTQQQNKTKQNRMTDDY